MHFNHFTLLSFFQLRKKDYKPPAQTQMGWYHGNAFCNSSTMCSFVVCYQIALTPDKWDQHGALLEVFTHYECDVSVHGINNAFSVFILINAS